MCVLFFFKQKTAYEMRISDWSSDVCSSDLMEGAGPDLHVVGLQDDAALARPEVLQAEDQSLKAGIGIGVGHRGFGRLGRGGIAAPRNAGRTLARPPPRIKQWDGP